MPKPRTTAELHKDRKEGWIVKINLPGEHVVWARPGRNQRIIYSNPQHVPTHLKEKIVPDLMREALHRNLLGT